MKIGRRTLLVSAAGGLISLGGRRVSVAGNLLRKRPEEFGPNEASLRGHRTPAWFRDAKFGISAQWIPQSLPEQGDWYARNMYRQGTPQYEHHLAHYGHPSRFGYKDLCRAWKGERWDPATLLDCYKAAGARYFVALANHHDGFDCWNSSYQPWNAASIGPKRDVIRIWSQLARERGLRFGAAVFAAQNWDWFLVSHGSDRSGPLQGIPYDGCLKASEGAGKWWAGLAPQALYGPAHADSQPPSTAYCQNYFDRTSELLTRYRPDLIFYTSNGLPLSDVGLRLAALQLNLARRAVNGENEAVVCTKRVSAELREAVVCDMLPGDSMEATPWQMDICIGDWLYKRDLEYRGAEQVIPYLVDIVSKNGNLLLNIPLRADGTVDDRERRILEDIGFWMRINGEAIYGTRPWKIFGEGPTRTQAVDFPFRTVKYGSEDIRFTVGGETLYAIALGWPANGKLVIRSFGRASGHLSGEVRSVRLAGVGAPLRYSRNDAAMTVILPERAPCDHAYVLRVT